MNTPTRFSTTDRPDFARWRALLYADPGRPHPRLVDLPFRWTSTWRDRGCVFGAWEQGGELLAWALYQPPWRNVDYALHPSAWGSSLEQEVFAWGKAQIDAYAEQSDRTRYGSIEFFADAPHADQTIERLRMLGFEAAGVSTLRFKIDLQQPLPAPTLPDGYAIRHLSGPSDSAAYVELVRAVFGSNWMTDAWRARTVIHPAYQPEIDLVVEDAHGALAGFCGCWLWRDVGQIEPLGVHSDHRGRGLGRALELAALRTLQRQGVRTMLVDHGSDNARAIGLSRSNGFRQINNALKYAIGTPPW